MRLAWMMGILMPVLASVPAAAFDHAQFCAEKLQQAEDNALEAGLWLDEHTHNESVSVHCTMRMIEFRRHLDLASNELSDSWRMREKNRWNAAHCEDEGWHEAIQNGWTIASTLITRTGERIWYAANCRERDD